MHLPEYVEKYDEFKAKGVDVVAVVAANDPYVMSGWARFEGLKDKVCIVSISILNDGFFLLILICLLAP